MLWLDDHDDDLDDHDDHDAERDVCDDCDDDADYSQPVSSKTATSMLWQVNITVAVQAPHPTLQIINIS